MNKSNTKLPEDITTAQLTDNWNKAYAEYSRAFRRVQLLDATDRGRLWEVLRAKFPKYQLLPDTNHISYVKNNLLASLYTVTKSAQILPTSEDDKDIVMQLNVMLDHYWGTLHVGRYQMQAGERAALTNLGITQVGWSTNSSGKSGPVLKNVDPVNFMYDPYATSFETASYCMTWEMMHESVLKSDPRYKKSFESYLSSSSFGSETATPINLMRDRPTESTAQGQKGYHKLIVHWVRKNGMVHEIHTIDNRHVLHVIEDVKPSKFPFALLYCNLPSGDLIGTSAPALIFSNSVAYNMMNSILLTAEYKNQRPPVFISAQSGINLASFLKHHNDADYTFTVNGDASKAVHYQEFPKASQIIPIVCSNLANDIQFITGIDGRYTGRDTGSILTTGGIESMLDQVTLIDAPKIHNYEEYTKQLTRLLLENLIEFGGKRKYYVKSQGKLGYEVIEVNFTALDPAVFDYTMSISSELPKNKARLAQMATTIMEKQMQYAQMGQQVELITPEEWLMWQDIPNKEYMLERMNIQRSADYTSKVSEILFTYGTLVKQGVDPKEAIHMTAEQMQLNETPGMVPEMAPPPEPIPEQPLL